MEKILVCIPKNEKQERMLCYLRKRFLDEGGIKVVNPLKEDIHHEAKVMTIGNLPLHNPVVAKLPSFGELIENTNDARKKTEEILNKANELFQEKEIVLSNKPMDASTFLKVKELKATVSFPDIGVKISPQGDEVTLSYEELDQLVSLANLAGSYQVQWNGKPLLDLKGTTIRFEREKEHNDSTEENNCGGTSPSGGSDSR